MGTPATRADIIEKLFSTFYVERRGKELVPTSKGMQLVELAPEELRSAALTAKWEDQLADIAKGKVRDSEFVDQMRKYATELVTEVKASNQTYRHDNQTRTPCPDCGKYLLRVKGKRGEMLVCPDRECGYRRSLSQTTNARCPNCHKKMELRGEGEKQMFACVCGYREKLTDFKKRRSNAGAGKRDVRKYLANQDTGGGNTAMADALAKWKAAQEAKDRMKLISWNVNGLRACLGKGFREYFDGADADFFCLQETKLQAGQVDLELPGYHQYWNYAEKKGYSGTAIFAKEEPISVQYGIGVPELDTEGRLITLEYPDYYVVTCYTPNAQEGPGAH